ncbi:formate C-acetyltransferase [Desulfitobacterium sp. LBE]|uniref:pyruvate formate lyase family protein n=1 Tax=Desulfitobacterium sp. LBE TaxID=884086 RepID=UPI00119A7B10|nr:pyruvate formate lyase family protein [Desulfitobacterium sp. LBE]TWH59753.1 formate C-acetyltransferase [Desulfitobacterium sp. LBE]
MSNKYLNKLLRMSKRIPASEYLRALIGIWVYTSSDITGNICKILRTSRIYINQDSRFVYSIDPWKIIWARGKKIVSNNTPAYERILKYGLKELCPSDINPSVEKRRRVLDGVIAYATKLQKAVEHSNHPDKAIIAAQLTNMQTKPASDFREALQRILFANSLIWQAGHRLNGLGHLDSILEPYYTEGVSDGTLTRAAAKDLLRDFLKALHEYYWYKSQVLVGDTGQIIILGGDDGKGGYVHNDLTELFLELSKELVLPDPKILLRVNKNTPRRLYELSLDSIATGCGAPLFTNDDVVIPQLIAFGYDKEDAYKYGTSACWEPLMVGKSSDANNAASLNLLKPLLAVFDKEKLSDITLFDDLFSAYAKSLSNEVQNVFALSQAKPFVEAPLLSLFMDLDDPSKDISEGGCKYNGVGITTVGMANAVNSLQNIKNLVFDSKELSLSELNSKRVEGFSAEWAKELKENAIFGHDLEGATELTEKIKVVVSTEIADFRTNLGGKAKFGLSSPSYIDSGKTTGASFDGRDVGEPLAVHISGASGLAPTELVSFASGLDYSGNKFNGNVVDFFVSPNFTKNNYDKFVDFLMLSQKRGYFQMQMNVVSAKTLTEARKNPKAFPDLVVRVWGFSAYFKDLPDSYKDVLIERALAAESR